MRVLQSIIYRFIRLLKREFNKLFNSERYNLIKNPNSCFEVVGQIAPPMWIKCDYPEVFLLQKRFSIENYLNSLEMYRLKDAIVSFNSDLILTNDGCLWEKSYRSCFSAEIPLDSPLLSYNSDSVLVENYKKTISIEGRVLNLNGVHSHIWAHFVVMALPKLYYAGETGLLNEPITILTPSYKDPQLRDIVSEYLNKFTAVKWVEIDERCNYKCDELVFIPTLCVLADHSNYILPSMEIFTPLVAELLNRNLVTYYRNKVEINSNDSENTKIYIIRRNGHRSLTNYQEIEEIFCGMGFRLIDPAKMNFLEKVKCFAEADVVVGPLSGGFTNLFFCKSGAKVLSFATLPRVLESFLPFMQSVSKIDLLLVTGQDLERNSQPNYFVPKERIIEAYEELMSR